MDNDLRSDQQLIRAIKSGDTSAFDSLYFRYRDWVVQLAGRFSPNQDDALDVLQETFAYLVRKFPGFELTASMKTFLYPVVRNLALEIRRKHRRFSQDDVAIQSVLAPPIVSGDRADLASALSNLSDDHREVLLMRFVDGLKIGEIAQSLDIPQGTVKSRLHKALQQLRADSGSRRYFET